MVTQRHVQWLEEINGSEKNFFIRLCVSFRHILLLISLCWGLFVIKVQTLLISYGERWSDQIEQISVIIHNY